MNVYIYSDDWSPGSNTVLYLPLKTNTADASSYQRTSSGSYWTISYGTRDGVQTAIFWSSYIRYPITDTNTTFTVVCRVNATRTSTREIASCGWWDTYNLWISSNWQRWMTAPWVGDIYSGMSRQSGWHMLSYTVNWTECKLYVDAVLKNTSSVNAATLWVMEVGTRSNVTYQWRSWGIREYIVENVLRPQGKLTSYYTSTRPMFYPS